MAVQDSTFGLLLLPMTKDNTIAMPVHAIINLMVLAYHSLETTSSATLDHRFKDACSILITLCGMDRGVAQIMDAVPSTTHHSSVLNLINIIQMTLSYDCVLIRALLMKIF